MTQQPAKPRLLVLTSTFPRWTGDHEPPFVLELSRHLTDTFEVTVLAPHAPGSKTHEYMGDIQVKRFRYAPGGLEKLAYEGGIPSKLRNIPWTRLLVPFFLCAQFIATWRLIRRLQPDTIHAHWLLPQGLIGLLARRLTRHKSRFVVTAHGADVHGLQSSLATRLKRWTINRSDAVTVVSEDLALRAKSLSLKHDNIHVLPMGVDLSSRFIPGQPHPEGQTLVFAGRLVEKKGVSTLLQAMAIVVKTFPNSRLRIAGSGPLKDMLQTEAQQLGITDHVEFLGSYHIESLPDIFQTSDIAVFPFTRASDGDQEGLGLVMLEAMGCGLPVIAGDLPAVHDVITNGKTGLLVEQKNPSALAHAIRTLFTDKEYKNTLALQGRAFAIEHFDWHWVAARYSRLLREAETTNA